MELKIYKNQKEVKKVYTCNSYDIMLGTLEDILEMVDTVTVIGDMTDAKATDSLMEIINKYLPKIKELLKNIFIDVTDDELKCIKVTELIPLFIELLMYVKTSLGGNSPKN